MSDPKAPSNTVSETTNAAPEDQIGARIAQRRLSKGLNHDGLSKLTKLLDSQGKTGISRTTIRGYEVGLYKPGTREIRLLSEALETSPNWLIFGGLDETRSKLNSYQSADTPASDELQKLFVALYLLHSIDATDRDVVYNVLHSIARLKLGENQYRAGIQPVADIAGVVMDALHDVKEGGQIDQGKLQNLLAAYVPTMAHLFLNETTSTTPPSVTN